MTVGTVVVGEVLSVARHPNADRLSICKVNVGESQPLNIVCGAPNVTAGMKVPCARIGAELPGEKPGQPFVIKAAKMRGEESQGMLCSARELKLSEDHGGLLALSPSARPGEDVRRLLALDDRVYLLKLTPNRADCLSVLGVAREVAALTGSVLKPPSCEPVAAVSDAKLPMAFMDPKGCGRFAGRIIRGVNAAAPTPEWIKQQIGRAHV